MSRDETETEILLIPLRDAGGKMLSNTVLHYQVSGRNPDQHETAISYTLETIHILMYRERCAHG